MVSTMSEMAIPPAVMNGTPATARPRIAMTTVPPAKTTDLPAVATARPADSSTDSPVREVFAVPGDEDQRVVDAHAEADHAAEHRRPTRDVDQIGDQGHRADPERETEQRHADRQSHRDDRSEREQQDDDRGEQADRLAESALGLLEREEQVAAQLDPEREILAGLGTRTP